MINMRDVFTETLWGMPILHSYADLAVWELFLRRHGGFRTVIELGTWHGTFSTWLLLACKRYGYQFWTFDHEEFPGVGGVLAQSVGLREHCIIEDVLKGPIPVLTAKLAAPENHPILLYCDNGNKSYEAVTYAPMLKAHDALAVHDWGSEIAASHIEPIAGLLEPTDWEDAESVGSLVRFWWRK